MLSNYFLLIFFDLGLSIHIYLLDFDFTTNSLTSLLFSSQYLYLYVWTISLWSVPIWLPMHANWLHLTYSLGYFLTTLDFHVQIQEPGPWWPYCSWSECAVEAWISGCLSGAPFLPALLDRFAKFSSCYSWVFFSLFISQSMLLCFLVI